MVLSEIMSELHGRVFARQTNFNALAGDLREQTVAAQTHLIEKKTEVFTSHHSALVKVPQSVRGKELVDFLIKWLTPAEEEKKKEETLANETEKKEVAVETENEGLKSETESKTEETKAVKTEEVEVVKTEVVEVVETKVVEAGKTEEASKIEIAVETETTDAPKEEAVQTETTGAPQGEAVKTETTVTPEEEAVNTETAAAPKEETVKEEVTKAKKEKKEKKIEKPSPYRARAKEIAEALVLSGFITAYKDRVKNYLADSPKEFVTDNELFVPLSNAITESKDTSVWDVVDGAIYASQLKRKAGVFAAFTQGKDVYVVVNEKTQKITFFESDVARTAVAEYAAADGFVQYDNAHFQFGVKLVYGDKFELLNLVTKDDQEAFLNTLLNIGVPYREVYNLAAEEAKSFYELTDFDMEKKAVSMEDYKGKVVLVVNVSSKCGLTPTNYPELQQLHEKYQEQGLVVLGFPCNQFAGQEPGTHEEILEFVKEYNVTFPLFEKHDVNGANARPVFTYLKAKLPGTFGNYIKWNFTKFLVDRNGQPYKRYAPKELPLSFEDDIKELLAKAPEPEKTEEVTKDENISPKSDEFTTAKEETMETTTETKEEALTEKKEETSEKKEVATEEKEVVAVEKEETSITETKTEQKEEVAAKTEEVVPTAEAVKTDDVAVTVTAS